MNCSNCGALVAPDAGFCRNCGAILRGKAASATVIPSAPYNEPAPPATGPEPPVPPLAEAGYWAPPQQPLHGGPGYPYSGGPAYPPSAPGSGTPAHPEQGYGQPGPGYGQQPPPGYHPGQNTSSSYLGSGISQAYPGPTQQYGYQTQGIGVPAGPHTVPTWGGGAPWAGAVIGVADLREKRRLQALDLTAFFGAAAVLGSLFMPWYQIGATGDGLSIAVSLTALGQHAGGWRWAIFVCSLATAVELLATLLIFKARVRADWPHRSVLGLLCAANLAMVIAAMISSPFNAANGTEFFGGLSTSLGAGAYVGLIGAVVAMSAGAARLFTGPPALTR